MAGGEVCLLEKPPTSVSYALHGSGLESPCFEEQDHTESPAVRREMLLIVCVCSGVWLLLGRGHWHRLSKVGCKNTAQASVGHGKGKRAVCGDSCCKLLYKQLRNYLSVSFRKMRLTKQQHGGVALFVDTVGLHAVQGLCQVGNPINILVTQSY